MDTSLKTKELVSPCNQPINQLAADSYQFCTWNSFKKFPWSIVALNMTAQVAKIMKFDFFRQLSCYEKLASLTKGTFLLPP
ncbi:hypothetical protein JT05_01750 [Desulfosporosinus sp. Tol-M]|nr:hypothetical protein JT05_01750 [Desulfosporosinus sp. Tol-M]